MIATSMRDKKLAEERVREFLGREGAQVFGAFAHSEKPQRQGPWRQGDGANRAALGGAVELRENQAGQPERIVEGLYLGERVLSGVGVEHEPDLVRRARLGLGDDALDLAHFLHEVPLRRKASRG